MGVFGLPPEHLGPHPQALCTGEGHQSVAKHALDLRATVLASLPAGLSEPDRRRQLYERVYGEPLPDEVAEFPAG